MVAGCSHDRLQSSNMAANRASFFLLQKRRHRAIELRVQYNLLHR
jgi:hypothetical protein